MTIGERIKQVRKENSLTLVQFAERIRIAFGSVSKLEKGENNPSDRTIALICSEFNVSEEWLRTGEGEMYVQKTTFDLTDYAKSKGASDLDIRIVKAYFSMPEDVRRAVVESLRGVFSSPTKQYAASTPRNVHDMTPDEIRAEMERQLAEEASDREKGTATPSTGSPNASGADCG